MPSRSLPRLLRTLWYLRGAQWRGLLRQRLVRGDGPVAADVPTPRLRFARPPVPWLGAPPHARFDGHRIRLIHREIPAGGRIDWDVTREGPLFADHLHRFDWIRSEAASPEARLAALRDWLAHHRRGPGWQPAPTSLRLLSWIKLLTTPGVLPALEDDGEALRACLAEHVATVAARLETHRLASPYLWNLIALVFAGLALEGEGADRALAFRTRLLAEIEEQILPDGAHVERSPMIHALLLESLLDLVDASRAAPGRAGSALDAALEDAAARMLGALAIWTHPDGAIALFGDSAFGIAHPPAVLRSQARALGIAPRAPERPGLLDAAGFVRLEAGPLVLIASASVPMPAYQPGHAHCDALSFELSVGETRVVTDTGVFGYVSGPRRHAARTTAAHATIEVEGQEQAEIWAAHRVGGRPDVALIRVEPGRSAQGVCAGWATPEVLHRRTFTVDGEAIAIHDRLDRPARTARLFLPLAPGLAPRLEGAAARVPLPGGRTLEIALPASARFHVARTSYFPEFGHAEERVTLVGEAEALADAHWRFALG